MPDLDCDDDDGDGPCWCGEPNPAYNDDGLRDSCGGTGMLECLCGGDFCVCHNHGEVECDGCEDCNDLDGDDLDDEDRDCDDDFGDLGNLP